MTTLMAITTGDNYGSKTRRCDAKCYDAKGPACRCICGGRNHGVGVEKAFEQTQDLAYQLVEHLAEKDPGAIVHYLRGLQPTLAPLWMEPSVPAGPCPRPGQTGDSGGIAILDDPIPTISPTAHQEAPGGTTPWP